jgi:arabinogalactan endo-1,4-beta-galactosidase
MRSSLKSIWIVALLSAFVWSGANIALSTNEGTPVAARDPASHRKIGSDMSDIPVAKLTDDPNLSAVPLHATAEQMQWWRDAKFGLFIHWGPVSLKGTEISWSRNGPRRGAPDQTPGQVPLEVYDNLYKEFNPTNFNARQWMHIAQAAGMRYVVLTAKHCDGFCLWPTKVIDYHIGRTPFRRDICGELAAAAHEAGLRLGWYYSPMDWYDPDCRTERNAVYVKRMQAQLCELLGDYGRVDLLWFDTDGGPTPWEQPATYRLVRVLQPGIIINNRLDMGSLADYNEQRVGPQADYCTPEQHIGGYDDRTPWETCMTLGTQWSWKPGDTIKSVEDTIRILARCAGGDGNLLLNVGPMPTGEIEPRQVEVLKGVGAWLTKYGESIYGTRGGPFHNGQWGGTTYNESTIYVHVLDWLDGPLKLPPLKQKILRSSVLTGGQANIEQNDKGISLGVSKEERDPLDTVIKLELDGPVSPDRPSTPKTQAPISAKETPAQSQVTPDSATVGTFILGADISFVQQQEDEGRTFKDKGVQKDIFDILKSHNFNYIRLRIFHNPKAPNGYSQKGYCDLPHTLQMARRIKASGEKFLLDFHYSDTWADPGKQFKPRAWQNLSFDELTKAVYDYTKEVIAALRKQGTPPDIVQIGNEINNGFLWPDGKPGDWDKFTTLLKAAIKGVKDADPSAKIMLHIACGGQNAASRTFMDNVLTRGVQFDILGQSYYPRWHGTLDDLRNNLKDLAGRYKQDIIVAEYSQYKRQVNDIVHNLPNGKGLGTFIWEPTKWGEALFDKNGNTLPEIDLYAQMAADYNNKSDSN